MPNVSVYSTPTCPYCRMVKNYLDEKKVAYTNIDVSANQNAAQEMVQKSGQMGVPVVDIDGQMIIGFDKEKISQILGL
ncbi:MAG: glutaredoxin family protein [Candidatus Margulisiibacteriota bacterium]